MSFTLTPAESALRHLLLDVAAYISPPSPSDLRFTGGWVRDKLLGIKSHDIDVGISDMTGYQFGLKLKEYLALPENELKYRAQGVAANLHKIEANPEKSKHLETVTTKIFGLDVDLVNLRKESYTEHSRNPQMAQGTPEEDALRRDATINAMFYNLKTQSVEDFTGLGHEDMKNKVIRTPLEPHQTFKDDPLRVLRLIRFASRFQYDLDPDVEKAMRDFSIRKALRVKISRERVGVEIEKMLKGPHPLLGLSLIHHLNLFETIFVDPHKDYTFKPEVSSWPRAYRAAEEMINESSSRFKALFRGVEDQSYHIWILSAAIPWAEAPQSLPLSSKGRAPSPLGVEAIRNGLKTSNKVTEIIINSFTNSEDIIVSKDSFLQHMRTTQRVAAPGSPTGRDTLGILIRKWGHTWKSQIAFAVMLESMRQTGDDQDIIGGYAEFIAYIVSMGLLDAPNFKPIVDGKTLAQELGVKPGPWMKTALDEVMAWQLRHPEDASPQRAIEAIRSKHGELPSCLIAQFLTLTIRPLFAQTKSQNKARLTVTGRRSAAANSFATSKRTNIETYEEAEARRPWKQENHVDSLQLLEWCTKVLKVDNRQTEKHWPVLVPPILALIDDVEVNFKARGCRLLFELLQATPPSLLKRTGLGKIFEDALTPCLSYLPTLTPQDESIKMLSAAYPAIFALASVRYPTRAETTSPEPSEMLMKRERMLSHLLHHHLLRAFVHVEAEEYPLLTTTLVSELTLWVDWMRLGVTPHLTHILPVVSSVLASETGVHIPSMLVEAAQALQTVIAAAWPRIWRWRGEILSGACIAWLNTLVADAGETSDEEDKQRMNVKKELKNAVRMLIRAVDAKEPSGEDEDEETRSFVFRDEIQDIITADDRLESFLN